MFFKNAVVLAGTFLIDAAVRRMMRRVTADTGDGLQWNQLAADTI